MTTKIRAQDIRVGDRIWSSAASLYLVITSVEIIPEAKSKLQDGTMGISYIPGCVVTKYRGLFCEHDHVFMIDEELERQ